jgi:hypothetical protein
MSSRTVLVAASILAAAIAYAGSQLGVSGAREIIVPSQHGDAVFHLRDGKVRYCQYFDVGTAVACTLWD